MSAPRRILLRDACVVTMSPALGELPRGSVLIEGERIAVVSPEQLRFLTYGRGIDTTRMRTELGFEPSFTTEQAFADFAAGLANPIAELLGVGRG